MYTIKKVGETYMKEKDSIALLNERLDSIEKILKMLVVNSLVDDINTEIDKQEKIDDVNTEIDKQKKIENINTEIDQQEKNDDSNTENDKKIEDIKAKLLIPFSLRWMLIKHEMKLGEVKAEQDITFIFLENEGTRKYKFKDYDELNQKIKEKYQKIVPIFNFKKLNGMQRKRFLEENISFSVQDKEIHICVRDT